MASIERRERTKGISFKVVWREDGRKKSTTFRADNKSDAAVAAARDKAHRWKQLIERAGSEAEADRALAKTLDTGPTLADVYDHYMSRHRGSKKTTQEYAAYWRNHLSPALGEIPVGQVRADDIRALVASLEDKGRAPKTIHNICGLLGQILTHAVEYEWIKSSPYSARLLPKNRSLKPERDHFLTRREVELIISAMRSHQDAARVMLATGMRPGELCALDVSDVNLDAQQPYIRVTKAVKQDRVGGDYIGEPKSERSVRTIGLPPSAVEILRPWVEGKPDGAPLFTQASGPGKDAEQVRLRRKRLYQTWQRTVERLRMPTVDDKGKKVPAALSKKPALYALRHTHASWMLEAGMSIWQLSRHLGHASVSITESTYAHLMPDAHYQAARYAAKALESA